MTVAEHLWFYARVKGATNREIQIEMEDMLKHLRLQNKRHELVDNLSGNESNDLSLLLDQGFRAIATSALKDHHNFSPGDKTVKIYFVVLLTIPSQISSERSAKPK